MILGAAALSLRGGILIIDNTCALPPVVYAKVMTRVRQKHRSGQRTGEIKSGEEYTHGAGKDTI